jgi:RNA polymerase sigma factor (sigma-70 family)
MSVRSIGAASDDELLIAAGRGDGEAFGIFYERHLAAVVAFVRPRVGGAEVAADVTAEVFAAALLSCERYRRGEAPAVLWLLGIAQNKVRDGARRGWRETRARERLWIRELPFGEDDLAAVEELAVTGAAVLARLKELPVGQREAVWGRIVEDKDYETVANELDCSQAVARQRVSRGLRHLRARLQEGR